MTQARTTAQEILLDGRDVAMLPWRAFAGRAGLWDRVLWQDPVGRTYAGLLHMGPTDRRPPTSSCGGDRDRRRLTYPGADVAVPAGKELGFVMGAGAR